MTARLARALSIATLPLVTGGWLAAAAAEDPSGSPRYTYFDAGYQWADVNYAVKQEGGQHEGVKLNGSVGLTNFGPVAVHLFGEFFDGDFTGVRTTCDDGVGGTTQFSGDRASQSLAAGLGIAFAMAESTDIVARAGYVDISEFETPNNLCQLVSGDDQGYLTEALIRSELSENVEVQGGVRYSDLSDSNISDTDVFLGIGYHLTDYVTIRAQGVVFDDDTGVEVGARLYFDKFLGRDTLF